MMHTLYIIFLAFVITVDSKVFLVCVYFYGIAEPCGQ